MSTPTTLVDAIIVRLKGVTELAALTDIYKTRPKRGWQFPYMVIALINGNDEIFGGKNFETWEKQELQFSTLSSDDLQAETLGELAYKALLPMAATLNPKLVWADVDQGYEIIRWPLYHHRMSEAPNRGPGNQNVWKHDFGYQIQRGAVPIVPSQFA